MSRLRVTILDHSLQRVEADVYVPSGEVHVSITLKLALYWALTIHVRRSIFEKYLSKEAFEVHKASPAVKAFKESNTGTIDKVEFFNEIGAASS